MKKIKSTCKKVITTLLGLLGVGTLTSCYGCFFPDDFFLQGTITGDINGDGIIEETEYVPGIQVYVDDETEFSISSENGTYYTGTIYPGTHTITFKDADGAENGDFKDQTIEIEIKEDDTYATFDTVKDIKLERK